MYRRYAPNPNPRQNPNSGQNQNQNAHPPSRPQPAPQTRSNPNRKPQPSGGQQKPMPNRKATPRQKPHPETPPPKHTNESPPKPQEKKKLQLPQNPILGLIPTSVYNPETKKVLGMFSAEDLLLAGLIFLLLENEENDDPMLVYALFYILISDYIDLPF